MNPIAAALMLAGSALTLVAAVGQLRFRTPYARFHAAGKASPIALMVAAIGALIELGPSDGARLAVAAAALLLTLPVGVHMLFRAVHRTEPATRPDIDELAAYRSQDGS